RLLIEKKIKYKEILWYAFPFIIFACIALTHYIKTGWVFISTSPDYAHHRELVPFSMIIRQSIYIIWYIVDFGRAFLWLFITAGFLYLLFIKKKTSDILTKRIIIISICSVMIHVISLSPFSNPIAHRYFLNVILFAPILFCWVLQEFNFKNKIFYAVATFTCIGLITGNFWIYGGGFSNGWDSSLKTLPYFKLKNEMQSFVEENKINPEEIGTKFPLYQNINYTDLTSESFQYSDISNSSLNQFRYILLSNISNQFTVQERKILNQNWLPVYVLHKGQVYLKLLKNPDYI
ncbi:MAG: hypothetical protein JJE25_03950, partial [Bacteroidia bacterium]|nr:hypothetical protein [Bacteroidia bacterium]